MLAGQYPATARTQTLKRPPARTIAEKPTQFAIRTPGLERAVLEVDGLQWVAGCHRLAPGNPPGRAQSLRLTPKASSFFAYESLRFVAFAAVSVAAWTALGPFCAAALINPDL